MSQKFLKGFKIDRAKLEEKFGYHPTTEDPQNMRYDKRIIGLLPRTSYKYIGAGLEEDDDVCLVVVMADGRDKEELEKMDMPFCEKMLAQAAKSVLTPGVWPSWD
ncbi:hypothetical protein JOM56_002747 [Amanita muscaria]